MAALFTDARVNACIPIAPLTQLANGSDITPKLVNDTSTTFCAMPFCNSATVALMENTVNQNCANSTEDAEANYWLYGVASLYVPFKQGMCQRVQHPPTNGTFCATILTETLDTYTKHHPNKKGWDLFDNATQLQQYLDAIPPPLLCTDCNKAMLNPLDNFVSVHQLSIDPAIVAWVRSLQASVQRKCGDDFIDDILPPPPQTSTAHHTAFPRWTTFFSISGMSAWSGGLSIAVLILLYHPPF
ncbi:hypothetical protein EDD11_000244 [Mortierella claussenii]|nr:hypothetical protein EDD11_000244 [Mortierella claussenii]